VRHSLCLSILALATSASGAESRATALDAAFPIEGQTDLVVAMQALQGADQSLWNPILLEATRRAERDTRFPVSEHFSLMTAPTDGQQRACIAVRPTDEATIQATLRCVDGPLVSTASLEFADNTPAPAPWTSTTYPAVVSASLMRTLHALHPGSFTACAQHVGKFVFHDALDEAPYRWEACSCLANPHGDCGETSR